MTREEALNKIKELEDYIKKLDNNIGYENDKLFMLSTEEYKRYKNVIPKCNTYWWLRSPGYDARYAARVDGSGCVNNSGRFVNDDDVGIRPALKVTGWDNAKIGTLLSYGSYSFTVIDKILAIATVPIFFDKFDDDNNDYATSYVRKWLLDFAEGAEE